MGFDPAVLELAAREREIGLTTYGRATGRRHRVTLWISGDGRRLFVRSGRGLGRHWTRNVLARGEGLLHIGGMAVPVRARHVDDPAAARAVSELVRSKYGAAVNVSRDGEALTPGEQATFELLPASD